MNHKHKILPAALIIMAAAGISLAQNYKIRQAVSVNGQKSESTTYVKGQRKRTEGGGFMGMGADVATVEQCDLKRNLKISDKKRLYAVDPFYADDGPAPATPKGPVARPKNSPAVRGGIVTYVSNVTDTGERKQMFGMTARHVKTSMTVEASPDACTKQNMRMETDGWYIDLPEFSCPISMRPQMAQRPAPDGGGCRDDIRFRSTGGGKTGFPLTETRTMNMGGGEMAFTQTTETLEFSKAVLEASLFDIPQGYGLVNDAQELYGKPDYSAIMGNMGGDDDAPKSANNKTTSGNSSPNSTRAVKRPGAVRIGVYVPVNRSAESISTSNLQYFLVQKLNTGNVEAVPIGSEADARAANCDYVLTSDFSRLKQSAASKVGGIFGKITSSDTTATRNFEAQVDFKLVSLASGQAVLQNKASTKSETDANRAAETVLAQEASAVLGAAK